MPKRSERNSPDYLPGQPDSENTAAFQIILTGRVQRVGFRFFVAETAQRFPVTGWVRNLTDGSVEVFAQGDAGAIKAFVKTLREGPPLSRVDQVRSIAAAPDQNLTKFSIRA